MKIKVYRKKQVIEEVIADVENHSRVPTWYVVKLHQQCHHCGFEFRQHDEIEVIHLTSGPTVAMHANCFMSAVNEGNKSE